DEIEKNEAELKRLNESMQQASQTQNATQIANISRAINLCQQKIDRLFIELEELTRKLDTHNAEFENRLQQLDR
ncbi:MAG: hypothetical protein PVF71_08600, partial [Desulfobacterales bacterium]